MDARHFFKRTVWISVLFCALGTVYGAGTSEIPSGSTVTFNYVLKVHDRIIDQSRNGPMRYVQGSGQIVPGLEDALKYSKAGDKLHVTVPPEKGYGPVNSSLYQNVPKKSFKDYSKLKTGSVVSGQYNGIPVRATIMGIDKKNFILDLNHPLAGETLQFDIEVVRIDPMIKFK